MIWLPLWIRIEGAINATTGERGWPPMSTDAEMKSTNWTAITLSVFICDPTCVVAAATGFNLRIRRGEFEVSKSPSPI